MIKMMELHPKPPFRGSGTPATPPRTIVFPYVSKAWRAGAPKVQFKAWFGDF